MNPYPAPSSITMQRTGEQPITITLEDAVVIMTNQQKTIEELIVNNQRMFQYIQDAQRAGGFGNIQFAQQNLSDPASHIYRGGAQSAPVREKPMSLNEYLAMKKSGSASAASSNTTTVPPPSTLASAAATPAPASAPMTLSEFLALKKSSTTATPVETSASTAAQVDEVPIFDTPSKTDPVPL